MNTDARAQHLAALADPVRLAVVDSLVVGDRSPGELGEELGVPGNLLAHHLNLLENAGVVRRMRSEGDGRRTYVQLVPGSLDGLLPGSPALTAPRVVFVCTHNSARSQLAAAVWRTRSPVAVASAGTRPAARIHPQAAATARRHGLSLGRRRPVNVADVLAPRDLVVSVCDGAHEELAAQGRRHLHWSVPDPVRVGTPAAFDDAYDVVAERVGRLSESIHPESILPEPIRPESIHPEEAMP